MFSRVVPFQRPLLWAITLKHGGVQIQRVAKRFDFLPFGEEIYAGTGGRTAAEGYLAASDAINPKFTGQQRDTETGLDFFKARYFGASEGRFTSAEAPFADQYTDDPQSWSLYGYVRNNPLVNTDPAGTVMAVSNATDWYPGSAMFDLMWNAFAQTTRVVQQTQQVMNAFRQSPNCAAAMTAGGAALGGGIGAYAGAGVGGASGAIAGTAVEPGGGTVLLAAGGASLGSTGGGLLGPLLALRPAMWPGQSFAAAAEGAATFSTQTANPAVAAFGCNSVYGDSAHLLYYSELLSAISGGKFGLPPHLAWTNELGCDRSNDFLPPNGCAGLSGSAWQACATNSMTSLPETQPVPTVTDLHMGPGISNNLYADAAATAQEMFSSAWTLLNAHALKGNLMMFGETHSNSPATGCNGDTPAETQKSVAGYLSSALYLNYAGNVILRPWEWVMSDACQTPAIIGSPDGPYMP